MPEHYRALIVILVLASVVFALAKAPATAAAMSLEDFTRRRNYWYFVTFAGFLSPNFWVFVLIVSGILIHASRHEHNPVALFFFLLLALPQLTVEIPGFAGIRYIVPIDYVRLLSLFLLVPACIALRRQVKRKTDSYQTPDLLLATYIILNIVLKARYDTSAGFFRDIFHWFVNVVVPYYAVSRSLKDLKGFRDSLTCFVVTAAIASLIGAFEFIKDWLVYTSLEGALGVDVPSIYLRRGEHLRAIATSGHAIVLGYVISIAIGFFLYLKRIVSPKSTWVAGMAILFAGEISPLSKGPWVGVAVLFIVFLAFSPNRISHLTRLVVAAPVVMFLLLMTDTGRKIVEYLPFVGQLDTGSAEYRTLLFNEAIQVIVDNPVFGSTDYMLHLEELRQGQGIIDLVNTYLIVALNTGFVGLGLYTSFFFVITVSIVRSMRLVKPRSELFVLGQSLLAVLLCMLVIIATTSPIFHIPVLLMAVSGLGVAYSAHVVSLKNDPALRNYKPVANIPSSIQPRVVIARQI